MALITVQMDINNWYSSTSARTVDSHLKTMDVFCAQKLNLIGTRMHSSRMRTARSSSRDGGEVSTSPRAGTPPPTRSPSTSPLGVGLETGKACWDTTPMETCCKACWDTTCNACWDSTTTHPPPPPCGQNS